MKNRVRMADIARAATVSKTTVSLVLNQIAGVRIAEDTRRRVIEAARELGYRPGPSLHDLDEGRQKIVGVLIDEISAAYPINLIDGLQAATAAQSIQIVIQVTGGREKAEAEALDILARLGARSVVYANTFTAILDPTPTLAGFAHVFLNCAPSGRRGVAVLPGERSGGFVAAQHLIDRGCKRLAVITGDPWQVASEARLAGFRRALKRAGLPFDDRYRRTGDWSHRRGAEAMRDLLALPEPPDGVFCHNDLMARGAMAALREAGSRIPEDVAVIGYDDREFAKDLSPSLTSMTLPHVEMAERAIAVLEKNPPPEAYARLRVRCQLVPRESTMVV